MAENSGVYPLDPTTDVGKFRLASGDTQSVPFDPVTPGFQNYTYASDAEIEQFLVLSGGSIPGSVGYWYLQLAGQAAIESASISDYDLKIDNTRRAADLRAQAEWWLNLGGIPLTGEEYFNIVGTGTDGYCWPELSERPYWVY